MPKQTEMFDNTKELPLNRRSRNPADLETVGPSETFSKEIVEVSKAHVCQRCSQEISKSKRAVRIIPKKDGKKDYENVEYYHLKNECPGWNER